MSFYCAVCNGFELISAACPNCHSEASDFGRFDDYLGPYSPYRAIDDVRMSNGYSDVANHQCMHMMCCKECNYSFVIAVSEWNT